MPTRTVYIASPTCDSKNPFAFHDRVRQYEETVEWINPFELNDYDGDEEARQHSETVYSEDLEYVAQSDAVLLRRISGYNLVGASIEGAVARELHDIPVVVYNDADDAVPLMLEALATEVYEDERKAVRSVVELVK